MFIEHNGFSFLRQWQNQTGIITQGKKTTLVETGEMKGDVNTDRTGDTERTEEHLMKTTDHEATERNKDMLTLRGTPVCTRPPVIIVRECKE